LRWQKFGVRRKRVADFRAFNARPPRFPRPAGEGQAEGPASVHIRGRKPAGDCTDRLRRLKLFSINLALGLIGSLAGPAAEQPPSTSHLVSAWLSAQTNLQTWEAQVIQVRTLKSLTDPLTATGRVWFAAPNQFRWELGNPAQTIAVRQPGQMLILYPRLKRAERYPLNTERAGPWRDALALLEAGFPRNESELQSRFRILDETTTNDLHEVSLQPRLSRTRQLMPQLKVGFSTRDFSLRMTELQFADGSTMRNEFTNATLNPRLDPSIFTPVIPPDFKVIDPIKKHGRE
jgi:outer membrane lipoprotein-sorting protein